MSRDVNVLVSVATVRELVGIAGLAIDEARATVLAGELQALRDDVRFISNVDVAGFEPSSSWPKSSPRAR